MDHLILINLISVIVILLLGEIIVRSLKIVSLQGYEKNFFYKDKGITLNKPNVLAKVAGKQVKTDENGFRIPIKKYNLNEIKFKLIAINYFVENYSNEDGVRELKHILKKVISKINLLKYSNNDLMNYKVNLKFPLNISLPLIKKLGF